jgi:ring-1,2-phenylacetyl-CoA epoxidase subunit PaaB
MEVYEVFRRSGHKDPFEHAGSVTAPDPEMALLMAKECFFRRAEGEHLWVVRRSDIHSMRDETILELPDHKGYRFPHAYRGVMELRKRARELGLGSGSGKLPDEAGGAPESSEVTP